MKSNLILGLAFFLICICINGNAQVTTKEAGQKYLAEEFIFFNWNNQQPIIYVFQVSTNFDGPKMIRDYRGWISQNGKWSIFLDQRVDNQTDPDTKIMEIINVSKNKEGQRIINYNYGQQKLTLFLKELLHEYTSDASTLTRDFKTSIYNGSLTRNDLAFEGIIIHQLTNLLNENPLVNPESISLYGSTYDQALLFTANGDVIIATNNGSFSSKNEVFFWKNNKANQSLTLDFQRTVTDVDSTSMEPYPTSWKITLPQDNTKIILNNIGSFLQIGLPEDPTVMKLLALSTVRGVMTNNKKNFSIAGLVKSINNNR